MSILPKYTEQELLSRMCDWCNKAERCAGDLRSKLKRLGAEEEVINRIIQQLKARNFYDDSRYASAFAHDKSTFGKWGVQKIRAHLRAKGITDSIIRENLALLDDSIMLDNIGELAKRKWPSLKGRNDYERKAKLMQFLLRKGFTGDQINKAISQVNPQLLIDLQP